MEVTIWITDGVEEGKSKHERSIRPGVHTYSPVHRKQISAAWSYSQPSSCDYADRALTSKLVSQLHRQH